MPAADTTPASYVARCPADPLAAGLHEAGLLTIAVIERLARQSWELCAEQLGIPRRRLLRFPPWSDTRPIVLVVEGRGLTNLAAWQRLASLAPGAVATPTRTAESLAVAPAELAPPAPRPRRMRDLLRARRFHRRQLRDERILEADLARWEAALEANAAVTAQALGSDLPDYARAAQFAAALMLEVPAAYAVAVLGAADAAARAGREDTDDRDAERLVRLGAACQTARDLFARQVLQTRVVAEPLIATLVADGRVATAEAAERLTIDELLAVARGAQP